MNSIQLTILTLSRQLANKEQVESLLLTTSEGRIEVLPGHAAMIGTISPGPFQFKSKDLSVVNGFISNGFFEVEDNHITLVCENLELSDEIDVLRAKEAQEKAEKTLREASLDTHQFKKYELKLQRAVLRQQVANSSSLNH